MKVEVNSEKRSAFMILGTIIVLAGIIVVAADWNTGNTVSHDANNIKVTISGEDYSLQEAIADGLIGGGSGGTAIDYTSCTWSGVISYYTEYICPLNTFLVGMISPGDSRYNRVAGRNYYCCPLI